MHFDAIGRVPGDPILGLMEAYAQDPNPRKFDLGVGVYKDAQGLTPILEAVKLAEQRLVDRQATKTYIGGHGDAAFGKVINELVLGADSALIAEQRAGVTQTPGGTGALRLSADFIAQCLPGRGVWLSSPTWPIHETIFATAGVKVSHYPYVGSDNRLDVEAMLEVLNQAPKGDVVLLHACCHNPTGADLTVSQWKQVAQLLKDRQLFPFIDMAYQGFDKGIEQDGAAVRIIAEAGIDSFIVANSYSKSFSLYGERVGALSMVAPTAADAKAVQSQVKRVIRTIYSSPSTHGAALVAGVLTNPELRAMWEQELTEMRERIHALRQGLVEKLAAAGAPQFGFINEQAGMFSYSGLSREQVERLRDEFGIYAVGTGRICVAALNQNNLEYVAKAVATVAKG